MSSEKASWDIGGPIGTGEMQVSKEGTGNESVTAFVRKSGPGGKDVQEKGKNRRYTSSPPAAQEEER